MILNQLKKSTCALIFSGLCAFLVNSNFANAETARNIVLVHGAFTDGSSWNLVTERLQALGYTVTSVQNPLISLEADIDPTKKIIERQNGDVILEGHS